MRREKPSHHRKNDHEKRSPSASDGYAFGKNSVDALIAHAPQRIRRIWVAAETQDDSRIRQLVQAAQAKNLRLEVVPRAKLDMLTDIDTPNQGILAHITPKDFLDLAQLEQKLQDLPNASPPLLLALDQVTDPHNFGAIIRVAAGAGVTAILLPKRNSAGITPVVRKASAGTVELVDLVLVSNLSDAINRLKDKGIWWVGAACDDNAVAYDQYDFTGPTGIVLGSEGSGLRRLVSGHCDQRVEIPMAPHVESLNVSVAGGILLFEALRQRRSKQ